MAQGTGTKKYVGPDSETIKKIIEEAIKSHEGEEDPHGIFKYVDMTPFEWTLKKKI